jgi:peptidoglycan/xylan/chitin deacetylase (PgdA/CDA1 family)
MDEPMRKGTTVRRALAVEAGVLLAARAIGHRRPMLGLAAAGAGGLAAWGAFARNSPVFGRVLHRGPRDAARFALTFDDGPGPSTPAVLDALREHDAHATFFVLGRQVDAHPELVRRILADGHELASHGYDHGILVFRDADHVADQIRRTERAIATAAGPDRLTRFFRAPHGFRGPAVGAAARRLGYRLAGWSIGVFDSEQPGSDVIASRAVRALHPGSVLLLHDADGWDPDASRDKTAEAIGPICRAARSRGLEPATLGGLVG